MHRILQNSYSASWRSTCCTTTVAPEMEARLLACRSLALALAWVGVDVVKTGRSLSDGRQPRVRVVRCC